MIRGALNDELMPMVVVEISNGDGVFQPVDAVLDTGFSGHLTLSSDAIARLGLELAKQVPMTLADGQQISASVYTGFADWFGRTKEIDVILTDGPPLLGMSLLEGCKIAIRVQPGGEALIEEDGEF